MGKLLCHREFEDNTFTRGKKYPIIEENRQLFLVECDKGERQIFTKKEDEYGKSYKDWFVLA